MLTLPLYFGYEESMSGHTGHIIAPLVKVTPIDLARYVRFQDCTDRTAASNFSKRRGLLTPDLTETQSSGGCRSQVAACFAMSALVTLRSRRVPLRDSACDGTGWIMRRETGFASGPSLCEAGAT